MFCPITDLALALTGLARPTAPCLNLAAAVVAGLVVRMAGAGAGASVSAGAGAGADPSVSAGACAIVSAGAGVAFEVMVDEEAIGGLDVAPEEVLKECGADVDGVTPNASGVADTGALDNVAVGGRKRTCVVMADEGGGTAAGMVVGAAVGLPLSMFRSTVAKSCRKELSSSSSKLILMVLLLLLLLLWAMLMVNLYYRELYVREQALNEINN